MLLTHCSEAKNIIFFLTEEKPADTLIPDTQNWHEYQ